MEKQIAVVGGGISGLLACKYALSKGFHPTVFESTSSIGGVWTSTCESTKLQNPKLGYQFSDFPWPDSVKEDFPTNHQVLDYIQAYADHFQLLNHIKLDTRVVAVEYEGPDNEEMQSWGLWNGNGDPFSSKGKWKVDVVNTKTLLTEIYQVDFVILCVGRFSGIPNIPEFPFNKGPEEFVGEVIHSMDYASMDKQSAAQLVKGKRIAIVGSQRSDLAPWGVPLFFLYFNRFSELTMHKPGEGFLLSLLASSLAPLRWAVSKFVESHIKRKLQLGKHKLVPQHDFIQDLNSCNISVIPENFYDRVEEGSVVIKKASSFSFYKQGIMVDSENTPLKVDLVIFATGYKGEEKLKNILVNPVFKSSILGSPKETVPLYRECINPRIPQLAVIGFSEAGSNLFMSEIRCRWLAELLDGKFKVPGIKDMEKDISQWSEYWKGSAGPYYRRSCIAGIQIWHSDQLCKDMGWNPLRKKGILAELFMPYGPGDYISP